jgi:hypothetical protein
MLATTPRRTAVIQRRGAAASISGQPAIALPLRYTGRVGRCRHLPTKFVDPSYQQTSTLSCQACILVNVHPGDPPITTVSLPTHSLTRLPRMNNLHSDDS